MKRALRLLFAGVVLAVIAFGFYLTGSPSENRLFREDELRVQDLRNISSAVGRHFREEQKAPLTLEPLIRDCEGQADYSCRRLQSIEAGEFEILIVDKESYELCTTFARAAPFPDGHTRKPTNPAHHEAGRQCYRYKFPKPRRGNQSALDPMTRNPLVRK